MKNLINEMGSSSRAATAVEAAAAADFVVVAVPLKLVNDMPVEALAGKIVLNTDNYMIWHDGHYPIVHSGEKSVRQLRQTKLAASKVLKAFTHIHAARSISLDALPGSPAVLRFCFERLS
ncbi:hypothetical protein B0G75_10349 [Paraburkholderia sp. BL18I3N2]|nr:hypothetical protein B0G75_10349 [Paraburkholderia sp. BL18I3N2]